MSGIRLSSRGSWFFDHRNSCLGGAAMGERFIALDGLRGAAALVVVTHHAPHLFPWAAPGAYLAVDLFFALSGFVIAHAYGARLATGLGALPFMWARIKRLYPLYLLGAVFGLLVLLPKALAGDIGRIAGAPFNFLMLPHFGTAAEGGGMFPLNPPAWSLLYELIANAVFAMVFAWPARWIGGIVVAGLVGLVLVCGDGLNGGAIWADTPEAFARVFFSFFVGVLIYRLGIWRAAPSVPTVAVILVFVAAVAWGYGAQGPLDLLIVAAIFPALITIGAKASPRGRLAAGCTALGDASYALYVLHVPMVRMANGAMIGLGLEPSWWVAIPFLAIATGISWLAFRYFDGPVRRMIWSPQRARAA
jgi:peptidoglycan/LPS O-acetylase OafA/YrhL